MTRDFKTLPAPARKLRALLWFFATVVLTLPGAAFAGHSVSKKVSHSSSRKHTAKTCRASKKSAHGRPRLTHHGRTKSHGKTAVAVDDANGADRTFFPIQTCDAADESRERSDDGPTLDAAAAAELRTPAGGRWIAPVETESEGQIDQSTDASAQSMPEKPARRNTYTATYSVKPGDSLRAIAYRYFTSPALVAFLNQLPFDALRDTLLTPGQALTIKVAVGSPIGFHTGERLAACPGVQTRKDTNNNWGRPTVVQILRQVFRETNKRWPQRHPALLGSLSKPGGGRLGHHKSHRSGQDVDIGYFTTDAVRADWGMPKLDEIDYQRTWFVIDALEKTGTVAAIFMHPSIQRRLYSYASAHGEAEARLKTLFQYGPKGRKDGTMIRNEPGHRDHFHVRILAPEDMIRDT